MRIHHIVSPLITKICRCEAITLYPFIFYKDEPALVYWMPHELVHVQQVKRLGWFRFYISYIRWHFKVGYDANPFELEAVERSGR